MAAHFESKLIKPFRHDADFSTSNNNNFDVTCVAAGGRMAKMKRWMRTTLSGYCESFGNRHTFIQILTLAMVMSTALMLWKTAIMISGSDSPVVVVLSGSMEPAFQRGDILFLWNRQPPSTYTTGEIVVFKVAGRDIPIVHRIHEVHVVRNGSRSNAEFDSTYATNWNVDTAISPPDEKVNYVRILTKGDNNPVADRGLYNPGQMWLEAQDISGKAVGYLPYVGMITIYLTDYPVIKYVLLIGLSLLTIAQNDSL